ncbi:MAG: acyl-CoA thioesterase, partial [Acholeplasmataceae bacterium]|nr:acyl-CoA thioesterase [Acholeplasmataceae bacterium]
GRNEFLYDPKNNLCIDSTYVIARLELDFIDEIKWPGNIGIGTAVGRIGNSSFALLQGLYQDKKLVGTAESVIVQVDMITRKSKVLSDTQKEFLSAYVLK